MNFINIIEFLIPKLNYSNLYFYNDANTDINNIPNKDFLINVCSQHTLYTKFNNNNSIKSPQS